MKQLYGKMKGKISPEHPGRSFSHQRHIKVVGLQLILSCEVLMFLSLKNNTVFQ